MATIGSLVVKLTAKDSAFRASLGRSGKSVKSFASTVSSASKMIAGFGTAAAAVAAGGFVILIKRQFQLIDATSKLADRLGVTTEALTAMRHAASIAGLDANALDTAMTRLMKNMSDATVGLATAERAFSQLGLSAAWLQRLPLEEAMMQIADAMQGVGTASDRMRIALDLFGRSGAGMINVLAGGSAGLREMFVEAERLGLTFDRALGAKVEAANDAITRLKGVMSGLAIQISGELAPFVEALAERFVESATSAGNMRTAVVDAFSDIITVAAGFADVALTIRIAWKALQVTVSNILSGLLEGLNLLVQGVDLFHQAFGQEGQSQFAQDFGAMTQGLADTTEEFRREFDELWSRELPSIKAEQFLRSIRQAAEESANAIAVATEAAQAAAIETVQKKGSQTPAAADILEEEKRLGKFLDEITKIRPTAVDAFEATLNDLEKLFNRELINWDEYLRERNKALELLESTLPALEALDDVPDVQSATQAVARGLTSPTAVVEGSAAAQAAIAEFRNQSSQGSAQEKMADSLDRSEAIQEAMLDILQGFQRPVTIKA